MTTRLVRLVVRLGVAAASLLIALLLGMQGAAFATVAPAPFDRGELGFGVEVGPLSIRYRVFALFVLPGEAIEIGSDVPLDADAAAGHLEPGPGGWTWTAPEEPGHYPLRLRHAGETMTLNLFVMRPAADLDTGRLGRYRIGDYPEQPFRGLAVYAAPRGFVEVSADMVSLPVSPHFSLGQFLSKQASDWPKYLVLRPELLIKLERVLARVNDAGIRTDSFEILSGYRTPWYNLAIGNRTTSSRHVYGGAADLFIDVSPRDGRMDDLNGDGRISKADADFLYDLFESWSDLSWWQPLIGGLGAYDANAVRGPFVHVDARGYRARWGR